ncbi:Dihydroflavonol-4-reductase [Dirofilaria immitis]|nr:Dihydroflavonol-4-reductase [Dirofilaria immitis]
MVEEMEMNRNIKVLVTGASGFIGIHCVQQLLKENYIVRGTVRNLNNHLKIAPLKELEGATERLELVEADLESDQGWSQITTDCTYVLHVASPFPIVTDESVISTAVNGTLRVLRAVAKSSIKKVVLTSSSCAINDVKFKLTVINPTLVVGPLLHNVQGTSVDVIRRFLNNEVPAVPTIQFGLVDVRDVAQAHIRAMRESRSDGLRILISYQPSFWFMDIANVLRDEFSPQVKYKLFTTDSYHSVLPGYTIPRFTVPYPVVWLYSLFSRETKEQVLTRYGNEMHLDNSRAKEILGMEFIDPKESIIAMAYDIIERGMAPKRQNYKGPSTKTS